MTTATAEAFLYLFGRDELRASDWLTGGGQGFQALLIGQGYIPAANHSVITIEKAELRTEGYKRQELRGRKVSREDGRTLLRCSNLLWAGIGPPVDGPVVTGVAIVMHDAVTSSPVAFFRLPAQQLVGMNYGLNTKANEGVLLRLN